MTTVQILGIDGSSETTRLRANVQSALAGLGIKAVVEYVSSVDKLMKFKINGIPALVVNDTVVLQKKVPEVEDLKILLKVFLQTATKPVTMKKLLVPTDFSDVSQGAYHFALHLAALQNGAVSVVNVYHPEYDLQNPYLTEPMFSMIDHSTERLNEFVKGKSEATIEAAIPVENEVVIGFPVEEILRVSKEKGSDMIVMGSTGEKGFLEKLFGSVSVNVAQKSECPVLMIPHDVKYAGFRHILYASDYSSANEATLRQLIDLAKVFKADVHFVHVEKEGESNDYKEIENRLFRILFEGGEPTFSFTMSKIEGQSVAEGLNDYAVRHDIDLMVLVRPHRSFWENLFHKSVTKAMTLNTKIPILVLRD